MKILINQCFVYSFVENGKVVSTLEKVTLIKIKNKETRYGGVTLEGFSKGSPFYFWQDEIDRGVKNNQLIICPTSFWNKVYNLLFAHSKTYKED